MIDSQAIEKWLNENTFYCPSLCARISLKQCEDIRKRPSAQDVAEGKVKWNILHKSCRPQQCDTCLIWKKEVKMEVYTCKECGKEIEPWQNGNRTIKTICRDCMIKKISTTTKANAHKSNETKAFDAVIGEKLRFSQKIFVRLLKQNPHITNNLLKNAKKEFRTLEQQILYDLSKIHDKEAKNEN